MEFAGKTALVTGSGAIGGLGHATAKVLAEGGADLILTGIDPQRGARVAEDLVTAAGQSTGTVRFVAADMADVAGVRQLAAEAGAVDILVNTRAC
jgi:NAD(P)-dependent dehydrogenase (short-subunit alcohol dehydrogenase family)